MPHAPPGLMLSMSTNSPMDVGAVAAVTCVYCKKFGHSDADCWYKSTRAKSPSKNGGNAGGKGDRAFSGQRNYCKKADHKAIDCRKKKADGNKDAGV